MKRDVIAFSVLFFMIVLSFGFVFAQGSGSEHDIIYTSNFDIVDPFGITDLDNYGDNVYGPGSSFDIDIETIESDGSFPEPDEGFNVQVYIDSDSPYSLTYFVGNANYMGSGRWNIRGTYPHVGGDYKFSFILYCSVDDSHCGNVYGRARQVNLELDLSIGGVGNEVSNHYSGGAVLIKGSSDNLNLGDGFSVYEGDIDGNEFGILANGVFLADDNDEFNYEQRITLGNPELTYFTDSDYEELVGLDDKTPAIGFRIPVDTNILKYTLDFVQDAESTVTEGDLDDFEGADIHILGKKYYIGDFKQSSLRMTLFEKETSERVWEGESNLVNLGPNFYSVSIVYIDNDEVVFDVNGERVPSSGKLNRGDSFRLSDGSYLGVTEISKLDLVGEIGNAEFIIGRNKLELMDNSNIKINDDIIDGIKSYITGGAYSSSGQTIDKIEIEWNTDDEVFLSPEVDLVMPGFDTIKFSMADLVRGSEEKLIIQPDGDDSIEIKAPIKDGRVSFNLIYATNGVFDSIGKYPDERLLVGNDDILYYEKDVNGNDYHNWFVASYRGFGDGESYLLRARVSSSSIDGHQVDIDKNVDGTWVTVCEDKSASDTCDIGEVSLRIREVGYISGGAESVRIRGGSGVNFDRLYTKNGLTVLLPYDNEVRGNTEYVLKFQEEDKNDNVETGGEIFSLGIGNNQGKLQVSGIEPRGWGPVISNGGFNGFELGTNTRIYQTYIESDVATRVLLYSEPDEDYAEIYYPGMQSETYAEVFLSERLVCVDSDGGFNKHQYGYTDVNTHYFQNRHEDSCAVVTRFDDDGNPGSWRSSDPCFGDNCYVDEAYCRIDGRGNFIDADADELLKCPNGCQNGACIPSCDAAEGCSPTPIGEDIRVVFDVRAPIIDLREAVDIQQDLVNIYGNPIYILKDTEVGSGELEDRITIFHHSGKSVIIYDSESAVNTRDLAAQIKQDLFNNLDIISEAVDVRSLGSENLRSVWRSVLGADRIVELDVKKGWNLIPFNHLLVDPLSEIDDYDYKKYFSENNIRVAFVYDFKNNEYLKLHSLISNSDVVQVVRDIIDRYRYYNNYRTFEDQRTLHSSYWIYSNDDQTLRVPVWNNFNMNFEKVKLTNGWNFLTINDYMMGKSLNEWKGDCQVIKSAIWSAEHQGWDVASTEDLNMVFQQDLLGKGIVLNVVGSCRLGDNIVPPMFPQTGACVDSDGGINPLEAGEICIEGVCFQDYCSQDNMLYEYYCGENGPNWKESWGDCSNGVLRFDTNEFIIGENIGDHYLTRVEEDRNVCHRIFGRSGEGYSDFPFIDENYNCDLYAASYENNGIESEVISIVFVRDDVFDKNEAESLKRQLEQGYRDIFSGFNEDIQFDVNKVEFEGNYIYEVVLAFEDQVLPLRAWFTDNKVVTISVDDHPATSRGPEILDEVTRAYLIKHPSGLDSITGGIL